MSANGSLDFFSSELDVGTALIVDRMYREEQLASGEAVTLVCSKTGLVSTSSYTQWHQASWGGKKMGDAVSYIGREDDGRRRQIQLRGVEGLRQEVRRIQLVENGGPALLGHLGRLRLASDLHAGHALGDARDAGGRSWASRRLVSLVRSLVAVRRLRRGDGLRCAIAGLGILVTRRRGDASDGLRLDWRIGAVGSSAGLHWRRAVLLSDRELAACQSIGPRADLEGLRRISSLLLLARGGCLVGGGLAIVGRLLGLLVERLAVAIAGWRRHDEVKLARASLVARVEVGGVLMRSDAVAESWASS